MMTSKDFVAMAKKIADYGNTEYMTGCFGWPATQSNIDRAMRDYPINEKRRANVAGKDKNCFMFDCCNLIKAILWGFSFDTNAEYGGCKYQSNGVPDGNEDYLLAQCTEKSTNFDLSKMVPGEYLYMSGHCGIYIGDGLAVECTSNSNLQHKVAYSSVNCDRTGYYRRTWTQHGKLPYVNYEEVKPVETDPINYLLGKLDIDKPDLQKGSSDTEQVKILQARLCLCGYYQELKTAGGGTPWDGDFGGTTDKVLRQVQTAFGITSDGIAGKETKALLNMNMCELANEFRNRGGSGDKAEIERLKNELATAQAKYENTKTLADAYNEQLNRTQEMYNKSKAQVLSAETEIKRLTEKINQAIDILK